MKITLSDGFIDSLLALPTDQQAVVLNTCKTLMRLDNDSIEEFELPVNAPQLLADLHTNLKKRAAIARRRREKRRQAAADAPAVPQQPIKTSDETATHSDIKVKTLINAVNDIRNSYINLSPNDLHEVLKIALRLIVDINKYAEAYGTNNKQCQINGETQPIPQNKARKKTKQSKTIVHPGRRQPRSKTKKVSIRKALSRHHSRL